MSLQTQFIYLQLFTLDASEAIIETVTGIPGRTQRRLAAHVRACVAESMWELQFAEKQRGEVEYDETCFLKVDHSDGSRTWYVASGWVRRGSHRVVFLQSKNLLAAPGPGSKAKKKPPPPITKAEYLLNFYMWPPEEKFRAFADGATSYKAGPRPTPEEEEWHHGMDQVKHTAKPNKEFVNYSTGAGTQVIDLCFLWEQSSVFWNHFAKKPEFPAGRFLSIGEQARRCGEWQVGTSRILAGPKHGRLLARAMRAFAGDFNDSRREWEPRRENLLSCAKMDPEKHIQCFTTPLLEEHQGQHPGWRERVDDPGVRPVGPDALLVQGLRP